MLILVTGSIFTTDPELLGRRIGFALVWLIIPTVCIGSAFFIWRAFAGQPISRHQPDELLTYRYKPNLDIQLADGGKSFRLRTDRFGARIAGSIRYDQPAVVAIGGSQTLGFAVAAHETFVAHIARALELQAYNRAIEGHGGVQSLYQMSLRSPAPELIIYGLWADHLARNVCRCMAVAGPFCLERAHVANRTIQMPNNVNGTFEKVRAWERGGRQDGAWAAERSARDDEVRSCGSPSRQQERVAAAALVLERMAAAARAPLVVVWIPFYFENYTPAPLPLVQRARRLGITLVDVSAELARIRERGIPVDGHLTPKAHRVIADAVLQALRSSAPNR